jgi:hypothetical protein
MLTCYIKNFSTNREKNATIDTFKLYPLIFLPLFYIASFIYLFFRIYKTRNAILCSERKREIIKFLIYSIIYGFFNFPTIILYIITVGKNLEPNTFLSWFAYYCFLANISINLILSVLRIFQGHINIDFFPDDTMICDSSIIDTESNSNRGYSINNFFNRNKTNQNQNQDIFDNINININHDKNKSNYNQNIDNNDDNNNIREKLIYINENDVSINNKYDNIVGENINEKKEHLIDNIKIDDENIIPINKNSLTDERFSNINRKSNYIPLSYFIKFYFI